jgi:peptide/nickel transport system permease protein
MKRKKNIQLYIGLGILALLGVFLLLGLIYHPYTSTQMDAGAKLAAPTLKHWFGGDKMGRDIFTRVQEGLKTSLFISILATAIGTIGGTIIGALSGYYGGLLDDSIMRIIDVLFAIPSILLALVFVSLSGSSMVNIILALGIAVIPSFAKMMRTEFKEQSKLEYVQAAKLMGASDMRILFKHILPNVMPTLANCVFISINNCILAEAGLSYLGIGVQPPTASLGGMISEGQGYLRIAPFYVIFPGVIMVLVLIGLGLISDGNAQTFVLRRSKKDGEGK